MMHAVAGLCLWAAVAHGLPLPIHTLQNVTRYQILDNGLRVFHSDSFKPSLHPNVLSSPVPLGGSVLYGEYYVSITIGNSASLDVQVDTGSSDLAVASSAIRPTPPPPTYNPWASPTSSVVPCNSQSVSCDCTGNCTYTISYLDGSGFTADVFTDVVTVAGQSKLSTKAYVGAITKMSKGFETAPVDGIVGIAYPKVSEISAPTLIDSLIAAGDMDDVFSFCLNSAPGTGGVLTLGSYGAPEQAFTWTPIVDDSFYVVDVLGLSVAGTRLSVPSSVYNSGGAVVDSGTTEFLLPTPAFKALHTAFTDLCQQQNLVGVCGGGKQTLFDGYCFEMTPADMAAFPNVTVEFSNGAHADVVPSSYLSLDTPAGKYRCLGIVSVPESDGTIMGDVFMHEMVTAFDRANHRMGFARRGACSTSG